MARSPESVAKYKAKEKAKRLAEKLADPEAYRAKMRAKYHKYKGSQLGWQREDRKKNPEKYTERNKLFKQRHPGKYKEYIKKSKAKKKLGLPMREKNQDIKRKGWKGCDHEKKKKRLREWANNKNKTDPNYRIKGALRQRLYAALKSQSVKKNGHTLDFLGCTIDEFKAHIQVLFKPGMRWNNYGPEWELDHIKPCALFNLIDPEEQKKCFHWTNMQPLWGDENRRKWHNYDPEINVSFAVEEEMPGESEMAIGSPIEDEL